MTTRWDYLIVGAGIAGAAAAFRLAEHGRVLLVERAAPGAGASGVAVGAVSPVSGRRARPAWQGAAALASLERLLDEAGQTALFHRCPIVHPAQTPALAARIEASAPEARTAWLPPEEAAARFPDVRAPWGAALIHGGGRLPMQTLTQALVQAARTRGAGYQEGLALEAGDAAGGAAWLDVRTAAGVNERFEAQQVLFAVGAGFRDVAALARLHLHAVKGQTIFVEAPAALEGRELPQLGGQGYVAPWQGGYFIGSSFEHAFAHERPTHEAAHSIRARAACMAPALGEAEVLGAAAGVRATAPGVRLPMVGPLPGAARVWALCGLGAKGLLLAPFLAERLAAWLRAPEHIPPEIRVRRAPESFR